MVRALTVAGVNVLVVLVLLELVLRIFPQIVPPAVLIHYDPDLRSRAAQGRLPTANETILVERDDQGFPLRIWKPGVTIRHDIEDAGAVRDVTMDDAGFCNPPHAPLPSVDVITLGDSFTWCTSVHPEDTWTSRLHEHTGLSAYNLGKDGIGPYEYLQLLKQFGLEKSPRFVIMNVYEGNDLRDARKYHAYRAAYGREHAGPANLPGRLYRFLDEGPQRRHSYAYNLLAGLVTYSGRRLNPQPDFRYDLTFAHHAVSFNPENTDTDEVEHAQLLHAEKIALSVFDAALDEFAALAERHGFIAIVSYSPSAHTAYADFVTFRTPGLDEVLNAYSRRLRVYFAERLENLGIHFVDLTVPLQHAAARHSEPDRLLYHPTNLHFTRYGHEVVAEALIEHLVQ